MSVLEIDIFKDIPANLLTTNIMNFLAEASVICLDNQGHKSGVALEINGYLKECVTLSWSIEITAQMKDAWSDLQNMTEDGATYLAIIIIQYFTSFKIIKRSQKGTGFDYWLGEKEDETYPYQNKARLEVSGILKENKTNSVSKRLNIKLSQTKQSDNLKLPVYIVVVEFSTPKLEVAKNE